MEKSFLVPEEESYESQVKTKDGVQLQLKVLDIRDGKAMAIQIANSE